MKICDVCKGTIEPQLNKKGDVVWEHGHNADPILPNGRCCDDCNGYVLYLRLKQMELRNEADEVSKFDTRITMMHMANRVLAQRRQAVKNGANDNE